MKKKKKKKLIFRLKYFVTSVAFSGFIVPFSLSFFPRTYFQYVVLQLNGNFANFQIYEKLVNPFYHIKSLSKMRSTKFSYKVKDFSHY